MNHREGWGITESVDFFSESLHSGGPSLPSQHFIACQLVLKLQGKRWDDRSDLTNQASTDLQCNLCSSRCLCYLESWADSWPRPAASGYKVSRPPLGLSSPEPHWTSRRLRTVPPSQCSQFYKFFKSHHFILDTCCFLLKVWVVSGSLSNQPLCGS